MCSTRSSERGATALLHARRGGAYHRDHEGGRGGPATRYSAPVLVLEPGDVGLGHRKPTAMGRRRAAAPPPGDRALRIARSAQGQGRCASIADVSAVTTRADVCYYQVPRERWLSENPEVMRTWLLRDAQQPLRLRLRQLASNHLLRHSLLAIKLVAFGNTRQKLPV